MNTLLVESYLESKLLTIELNREIQRLQTTLSDSSASIERLTCISDTIKQRGISRPMMEACDPRGELVTASVFGSYEGLSQNNSSVGTSEVIAGLEALMDKAVEQKISLFRRIVEKIKQKFARKPKSVKESTQYNQDISDSYSDFTAVKEFDEVKFATGTVRELTTKSDVDRVLKLVNHVVSTLSNRLIAESVLTLSNLVEQKDPDIVTKRTKIQKDLANLLRPIATQETLDVFGVEIKISDGKLVSLRGHLPKSVHPANIGEAGWTTSALPKYYEAVRDLDQLGFKLDGDYNKIKDNYDKIEKLVAEPFVRYEKSLKDETLDVIAMLCSGIADIHYNQSSLREKINDLYYCINALLMFAVKCKK